MGILVSVVVPIYNVEKYLYKCVDSIINQTLKDIEIILVDDGSTDGSLRIADEFGLKDSRIKVIHKKNGGQGSARNEGIKAAKGEFVGFVDADDYIDENMYKNLYEEAKNKLDICVCSRRSVNEEGAELTTIKALNIESDAKSISEYVEKYLLRSHTLSVCNKMYKRELLIENKLNFKEFKEIGSEDTLFNLETLKVSNKLGVVTNVYYNQIVREGSTTRKYNLGYMKRLNNLLETLSNKGFDKDILYLIHIHFNERYISLIKEYGDNPNNNFIYEMKNAGFKNIYNDVNKGLAFEPKVRGILKNKGYSRNGILYFKFKSILRIFKAYKLLGRLEGV